MKTQLTTQNSIFERHNIEAGCKAIVVQRAKQSGMHWTTTGAASIIALRCQHASGRWDELWTTCAASPDGLRTAI